MTALAIEMVDTARWYCAVTNPNCHRRVELALSAQGFRNFTPKVKKWATLGRFRRPVERPLLGRYIFVEVDHPRQSFASVRSTEGVEGFITNFGQPVVIPAHWIDDLMRRYLAGEWDLVTQEPVRVRNAYGFVETRHNGELMIGDRVRIMEGEFEDALAFITGTRKGRITFKVVGSRKYGTLSKWLVRAA